MLLYPVVTQTVGNTLTLHWTTPCICHFALNAHMLRVAVIALWIVSCMMSERVVSDVCAHVRVCLRARVECVSGIDLSHGHLFACVDFRTSRHAAWSVFLITTMCRRPDALHCLVAVGAVLEAAKRRHQSYKWHGHPAADRSPSSSMAACKPCRASGAQAHAPMCTRTERVFADSWLVCAAGLSYPTTP